MILIAFVLGTGEKISQSIPDVWIYPLATNMSLYQSIVPSEWYFTEKTHLHPIVSFPLGSSTISQVEFS